MTGSGQHDESEARLAEIRIRLQSLGNRDIPLREKTPQVQALVKELLSLHQRCFDLPAA